MKKLMAFSVAAAALCAFAADKVAIKFEIPPPHSSGTPKKKNG